MDYYAYKYSVLQHLMELLNIKSVNIIDDNYQALATIRNDNDKLEHIPVKTIKLGRVIRLDFINNFHFSFDESILMDAYESRYLPSRTAVILKRRIIDEYVKGILKRHE